MALFNREGDVHCLRITGRRFLLVKRVGAVQETLDHLGFISRRPLKAFVVDGCYHIAVLVQNLKGCARQLLSSVLEIHFTDGHFRRGVSHDNLLGRLQLIGNLKFYVLSYRVAVGGAYLPEDVLAGRQALDHLGLLAGYPFKLFSVNRSYQFFRLCAARGRYLAQYLEGCSRQLLAGGNIRLADLHLGGRVFHCNGIFNVQLIGNLKLFLICDGIARRRFRFAEDIGSCRQTLDILRCSVGYPGQPLAVSGHGCFTSLLIQNLKECAFQFLSACDVHLADGHIDRHVRHGYGICFQLQFIGNRKPDVLRNGIAVRSVSLPKDVISCRQALDYLRLTAGYPLKLFVRCVLIIHIVDGGCHIFRLCVEDLQSRVFQLFAGSVEVYLADLDFGRRILHHCRLVSGKGFIAVLIDDPYHSFRIQPEVYRIRDGVACRRLGFYQIVFARLYACPGNAGRGSVGFHPVAVNRVSHVTVRILYLQDDILGLIRRHLAVPQICLADRQFNRCILHHYSIILRNGVSRFVIGIYRSLLVNAEEDGICLQVSAGYFILYQGVPGIVLQSRYRMVQSGAVPLENRSRISAIRKDSACDHLVLIIGRYCLDPQHCVCQHLARVVIHLGEGNLCLLILHNQSLLVAVPCSGGYVSVLVNAKLNVVRYQITIRSAHFMEYIVSGFQTFDYINSASRSPACLGILTRGNYIIRCHIRLCICVAVLVSLIYAVVHPYYQLRARKVSSQGLFADSYACGLIDHHNASVLIQFSVNHCDAAVIVNPKYNGLGFHISGRSLCLLKDIFLTGNKLSLYYMSRSIGGPGGNFLTLLAVAALVDCQFRARNFFTGDIRLLEAYFDGIILKSNRIRAVLNDFRLQGSISVICYLYNDFLHPLVIYIRIALCRLYLGDLISMLSQIVPTGIVLIVNVCKCNLA